MENKKSKRNDAHISHYSSEPTPARSTDLGQRHLIECVRRVKLIVPHPVVSATRDYRWFWIRLFSFPAFLPVPYGSIVKLWIIKHAAPSMAKCRLYFYLTHSPSLRTSVSTKTSPSTYSIYLTRHSFEWRDKYVRNRPMINREWRVGPR